MPARKTTRRDATSKKAGAARTATKKTTARKPGAGTRAAKTTSSPKRAAPKAPRKTQRAAKAVTRSPRRSLQPAATLGQRIVEHLATVETAGADQLAHAIKATRESVGATLSQLNRDGHIRRVSHGRYARRR